MTPFEEAQRTANAIGKAGYAGMYVTMSWGGEYVNAFDVEAHMPVDGLVKQIQARLKALGLDPGPADGIIGPKTLTAILAALGRLPLP